MFKNLLSQEAHATYLVAMSGTLYGVLGLFGTLLINQNLSINSMLFWRFFLASLWMILTLALSGKLLLLLKNIRPNTFKNLCFAIVTYCGSSLFYFISAKYIGTGIGMVIFFSYPIIVTLFSFLFAKWRMNMTAFIALSAVVFGLFLLKGNYAENASLIGILLGSVAAFCYACYVYSNRITASKIDTRLQTLLLCIGNTILFLILALVQQDFSIPSTSKAWSYALALGIVATALPIQLLLDGLKYINPIKASILSVLEPVVTVIIGYLLLNESMTKMQLIGIIIILAATLIIQFEKSQQSLTAENIS